MKVAHEATPQTLRLITVYKIPTLYTSGGNVVLALDASRQLEYFKSLKASA